MNSPASCNTRRSRGWPRKVSFGRVSVSIYRRTTPNGATGYLVANYATGKRRLDSYATEADALDAANRLARQLSRDEALAASLTQEQAAEYIAARRTLEPLKVSLSAACATLAECVKLVADLPNLLAAAKFYAVRHKHTTPKPVADVVAEVLAIKESRGASHRYRQDLRSRLTRFADAFRKDACHVTTAELQAWLDDLKLAPQSYTNFRRVLHMLFAFAVARGYAADNPVEGVERVKVQGGDVEIFTPAELARLLAAASPEFLPCLALGAFAGLRSAEIERLEWADLDLAGRVIVIGAKKAKTASRRVVPICDTLAAWLAPYAGRAGKVWPGAHDAFYEAQQATAAATARDGAPPVVWKANALRHSYASYRFAELGDAGRVAGELGNSAAVVHRHYRELVKPAAAQRWFAVRPESPGNVLPLAAAATN